MLQKLIHTDFAAATSYPAFATSLSTLELLDLKVGLP
jgi:hypothetical protein